MITNVGGPTNDLLEVVLHRPMPPDQGLPEPPCLLADERDDGGGAPLHSAIAREVARRSREPPR
jgi:hypothetical protein